MGDGGTIPAVSPNNSDDELSNKSKKDNATMAIKNKNNKNKNGSTPKSEGTFLPELQRNNQRPRRTLSITERS